MNLVIINEKHQPITTTLLIAEKFERQHDSVLRAVRNLDCSKDFRLRNFAESNYINAQGRTQPQCEMTKDGFVFLVMGFRGSKAARFKEQYIAEFNRMEEVLKQQESQNNAPDKPYSPLEALRQMVDQMIAQESRIKAIEERQRESALALANVPRSEYLLPQKETRAAIRQLVAAFCGATGASFPDTWNSLYRECYYRLGVNLSLQVKRHDGQNRLDVAEDLGILDDLYAIASEILVSTPVSLEDN